MTSLQEITLNFRRSDFEEIYFRNNNANYFVGPTIKSSFRILVVCTVLLIGVIIYYAGYTDSAAILAFPIAFYFFPLTDYIKHANVIRKWKKEIDVFLDEVGRIKSHKLILFENTFSLVQDEKETIENWGNFKSVEINTLFIGLSGNVNYTIPAKSMTAEQFQKLRQLISEKVK
ncbi:MAG: hypothetical protein NT150_12975 [Bacteroidetes bacterium]|nr:hypothetical protein [Bacteroidota bacterium]